MRRHATPSRFLLVFGVALAALLLTAPIASAARGVIGFDAFPLVPYYQDDAGDFGTLAGARAAGVNGPGAGGAEPGDVYVGDIGGGFGATALGPRMELFSATGEPKLLWGTDVVSSGPDNASEVQAVTVDATSGTFTLTFGGETTSPIPYNAAPGDVESALNALSSIGGVGGSVTVTDGSGGAIDHRYLVAFGGAQAGSNQPLLGANSSGLSGGVGAYVAATQEGGVGFEICDPANGDTCKAAAQNNEPLAGELGSGGFSMSDLVVDQDTGDVYVLAANRINTYAADGQFLRAFGDDAVASGPGDSNADEQDELTVTASGGSFTLSFSGSTTEPIPFNAPAADVQTALNGLASIGGIGGSVTVTGGPGDATGSSPYVITFGGSLGGDDVADLTASASGLTGTPKSATVTTTRTGGALEVCTTRDVCQAATSPSNGPAGAISFQAGLAVAPAGAPNAGNVLVADNNNRRVQEFTPDGDFVRAFGWGVVADGPDQNRETQTLSITGNGGTYTLSFQGQTTPPLAYDASPADIESALNGLSTIGGAGGSVTVTTDLPDSTQSHTRVVSFGGSLAGTNPPLIVADGSALTTTGFQTPGVTVSGGYAVCVPANGDTCQTGTEGSGMGQFSQNLAGVAEDSNGNVFTVEGRGSRSSYRVLKFTAGATPADLTPGDFGLNEVQQVTVDATAGQFRLGILDPQGTQGTGASISASSNIVRNVTTTQGTFAVGQPISLSTGTFARPGIYITDVNPGTTIGTVDLTLSENAGFGCGSCEVSAPSYVYTADLSVGATAAEVQSALNAVAAIGSDGGSVSVSGPAGGPYTITFDGGRLAHTNPPQLVGQDGTTPLTGGTGVSVTTTTEGGANGPHPASSSSANTNLRDQSAPVGIAVGPNNHVFVVENFDSGTRTCADGKMASFHTEVVEYDESGQLVDASRPCITFAQVSGSNPSQRLTIDKATGSPFFYDPTGVFDSNTQTSTVRGYILGDPGSTPDVQLNAPSDISPTGVTISGTVNPNGPGAVTAQHPSSTTYRVEYKRTSDSNWQVWAPDVDLGSGTSPVPFSVGISGLTPKAEYEARVIVTKPFGFPQVVKTTPPFTTAAAPPRIQAFSSSNITAHSADLHALINPLGTDTSYHFEYGKTPAYGQRTAETDIGDSTSAVPVTEHITGLDPVVYHFKVVATNSEGTVESTDQTFNFYPEPCPNTTVRQQTGSGSLPDCRAYELVSPGNAGAASLFPGGPTSPFATNPSRLTFYAALGSIPGPWNPPNTTADMYVATRTSTSWETHYVGIPGDVAPGTTGAPGPTPGTEPMTDIGMDRFLGWNPGTPYVCCGQTGSLAPYVWDATGKDLGRWPTNVGDIPNALKDMSCWTPVVLPPCGPTGGFTGDVRPSGDFSHFFFSSGNIAFTPDGQTSGMASVYDNDIASKTVSVVSKLPNGDPIPTEPGVTSDDYMRIPAASVDGSHVLMAASGTGICGESTCEPMPFPCGVSFSFEHAVTIGTCPDLLPSHLYMRVGGASGVTYDVSQGHHVDFQEMTSDGTKVFFTSAEQITADDHDSGVDLYMWSEETDSITRVSAGSGSVGDTDACNTSWTTKCSIEVAKPPTGSFGLGSTIPRNNGVASESGDVYFYSPEQLVGSNGIPGRRNLYVQRNGQLQYVATLNPDDPASRIEVTPDGHFAAFIAKTQLTPYDNAGHAEMYRYDATTGDLRCMSCIPTGEPPTTDVEGSQNGIYLTSDGRTFFSTGDPLVAADTNGLIDVYEFVNGRAQLISTGVAQKDRTRFGNTGLVGVSENGVDAFFSTTETLVPADHNGEFIKFYDARINGGFPITSTPAPCAAADECHGPGNVGVTPPPFSSSAGLSVPGNVQQQRKPRHKRRHHRKRHGHHHKKKHRKGKSRKQKRKHRNQQRRHRHAMGSHR